MALSAAPAARAADEKAYTLDYRAEDGCPSREAIVEQLGSRSRRLVETRRGGIPVSISLTHAGTRYEGRSRVALPDGVRVRSLDGATCEEVADALTLIVALNLDPDAGSDVSAADRQPDAPKPEPPPAPKPAPAPGLQWRAALGGGVGVRGGAVPNPGPALFAFAEADSEHSGDGIAPSFRLSLAHVSGEQRGLEGTGEFSWTAVALEACPLRAPDHGVWSVRPCAAFEVGGLHAEGRNVTLPRSPTRLWLAPALLARGAWRITPLLRLEANLGASFPLTRPTFSFDTGERLFQVPAAGVHAGIGVAGVIE
ncbi:MAG: hypothetical protein KC776_33440 [Myxococcales bacterium]|nr:hypothetical protein [Myxococcales bacterium]MCB9582795.1 hypothetical protein [Polyangiaceae bacterium]